MSLIWGLAIPVPAHLTFVLLGFLACGIWMFARHRSQKQVTAKTEASEQHSLKQIQKLTVSQLDEAGMNFFEADLTWLTLLELSLPESHDLSSSSVSDAVVQEAVPPCCHCKRGKCSTDYSESSGSSINSSSLSYLPIFSEATTWQFQSSSVSLSPTEELSVSGNQGTPLPTCQLTDPEKSDFFQDLAVLSPLPSQSTFISSILESLDPCKQQEKTTDKRNDHLLSSHGSNSVLNESPGPLVWAPLQLSPLVRGELEGHMFQKVSTLREQLVPLPVKRSWEILNHLVDVKRVPEQESPKTQLTKPILQSTEQNTNRSPDAPSFHLHVNIGVNAGLNRTEAKMSQPVTPVTSNKQLPSEGDLQVLRCDPLVISMGTPPRRNLGVNTIQEETTLLKKDPKHVLELSIGQRVQGLPEKRIKLQKPQVTNVELTPKAPCSASDSIKVTPLALLQVMDSMGMIPESHSEVIESVGLSPQPPKQVETVSIIPQPSKKVTEPAQVAGPQDQTMESNSMAPRLNQVTDNTKVTPVALFHVIESMGMINEFRPRVIEPVGIAPKPQHQVRESVKMDALPTQQAVRPGKQSLVPQNIVMQAVERILKTQHKTIERQKMTPGSQSQATKHIRFTPSPIHQNTMEISSPALHGVIDNTQATPVAQQNKDFMQIIPTRVPHIAESRGLIQGSGSQAANLTLVPAQPDVLTSTVPGRAVESRSLLPQTPSEVLGSPRMILQPSGHPTPALKVNPTVQVSPTGMITPLQTAEPPCLITQPMAQSRGSLELPSALQVQVRDSMSMMPQHQGTGYVSSTPGPPHQGMEPSKFTLHHQDLDYTEVSPKQSQKLTETVGLTSETWPQMKNPLEVAPSCHQITKSIRTNLGAPDQGTVPIEMSQQHQVTESEVAPATPPLQEMEYFGGNTIPQPKVMCVANLPPELQNVKSKNLVPDPRLQSVKSMDMPTDIVPEMVKHGLPTPTAVSTDLAPELHQQSIQSEELTPKSQLQSEDSVPLAPESQLQDMNSSQLTPGPQPQNVQCAGLAPDPQLQSNNSVNLITGSQSQGMKNIPPAPPQELQGDIKIMELTPRPSLEDTESVNLAPKPHSQNTTSDKRIHVLVLEDMKTPLVEGGSLIPEDLVESMKVCESIPSIQLDAVKSPEVSPDSSRHCLESEGLTLQQQVSEARVTSDTCHQVEESVELIQSSPPMTPAPLSQTSESMEISLPPLQDTLETRTKVVKGIEETLESQNTIKDSLDLLPESKVPNKNSEVMAPEPQPPDVKLAHVTLESCPEVTNPLDVTLRSEYEDTESVGLTLPKVDDTEGNIVEAYSEAVSLEVSLESGVRCKESESFAQNLKSSGLISESSELLVESMELTIGPKPQIEDVTLGPELHEGMSRQMDTESHLQDEQSVNLIQQPSVGVVDTEKTKPEPRLQSVSPKESIEGTQLPNMKSVDFSLGPQQPIVKSGLIPGPQLQSVRLPKLYQGELLLQEEKPANLISNYGVKSDEVISCSPVPEIRSSDFIPGPKVPEPQPQHMTPLDVNLGPSLQDVKFSDLIPQPEHHGFKYVQFIPGIQPQEEKSQGFMPESLLPLSEEPPLKDMKLALPTEESALHSMKSATRASELQCPTVVSDRVSPGLWQQDNKISELASRPKLQGVKFGEQTSGSVFGSISARTPEFGIHDPKLAKMTPGLQDTRQVSFNSGPWLQDVKFFDVIPGTQPQGVKTSEINSGPQLECVKMFELTTQPERQEMKSELVVQEPLFQDVKYVTENQVPSFKDQMLNKMSSEPQISNAESMKLTPGIHLAHYTDHSKLIRGPNAQTIESSEIIQGQHFGYIKPVEKITVSKHVELTSPELALELQLGEMKPMELRVRSELGQVKVMPSTPGMQAGDRKHEPVCSNLKDLKPEFPSSRRKLEDGESVILTLGQCLERIKSTVVSPQSSQLGGIKSVKLIPGSRIEDLKTVGLVSGTHVQDVNALGLKLDPKKQGENPVTFVPETMFQETSVEVFQGLQLQGIKPKELTLQTQIRDGKHVVTSCLKQQALKPGNAGKTQGIQGVKFVDLASTQEGQGTALTDLTLESGWDDQITIYTPEWKSRVFNQLKRQFESEDTLSTKSDQEPEPANIKPTGINSKVQFKDKLASEPLGHSVKTKEFQYEPQLPSTNPCQLAAASQIGQLKASESTLEPQLQGVKTMPLNTEPQIGSTKSIQWIPISEFQGPKGTAPNFRSKFARPTQLKLPMQWRGVRPSELGARSKTRGEKCVAFRLEPQLRGVKTSPPTIGLQKSKTSTLTPEPQLQGSKTLKLNEEPQVEGVRSVQWIPGPEFHGVKFLGLNHGSPYQGAKSAERKASPLLEGGKASEVTVGSKPQGRKSVDFDLGSHEQNVVKSPELSPGPEQQKGEGYTSTSKPQLQSIKTGELKEEPQVEGVRSVQWIPGPEFHGVKFLGLNRGLPSQGTKSTERIPSILLGGGKPSELTVGSKLQGKKPVDFNLGLELRKGGKCASTSELQSRGVKTVSLQHEPQLENTKSVQWIPVSDSQVKKSMPNLGLQSEDITAKELKPSIQLRDVKTPDELITRPKIKGKQPSVSAQEYSSHRFKTIDFKPELQFREMKVYDPALRSKVSDINSMTFKPGFYLEDKNSAKLTPVIVKSLESHPGTQPQDVPSLVLKQQSQSSEVNCRAFSQGPQSQNNKNTELKSAKFSELALQTKPRGMKSEIRSGPQWPSAKCSYLTPEIKSHNIKYTKLNPSSPLKGKPFTDYMGTKIQSVKLGSKPGPQLQSIKSDLALRAKPQEMEMEDYESGPQLQDLKSSRMIMGIKVQDVKSMDLGSGPHLQDLTSEAITEIEPCPKLQEEKPDFTPKKSFLGTKSVGVDSGPPLRKLRYPELILGKKAQGVNSVGQHFTTVKPSEVVTQIKSQGVTAADFSSEPQTQNENPPELVQGKRLHDLESIKFDQGPELQGLTLELIPELKPPKRESVKLSSGPQLQDEKYSTSILGTKLQDGRSTKVSRGPHLQDMKPSEVISGDTFQKEQPMGLVYQPLSQDIRSFQGTLFNRKTLQFDFPSQLQDKKSSTLIPEFHFQVITPEAFNPESQLKDVKAELTNPQTMKNEEVNHGTELQVVELSELALESPIYGVVPSELNAGKQKQDGKSYQLNQKQQLQGIKSLAFNEELHLQHIKSSELCTKLQDLKSMEFNTEQQLQDVKSSELGLGTGRQSLGFYPGPQLQEIKPSKVCTETKVLDESSLEFKHEPKLQDGKSGDWSHCKNGLVFNTGIQDVDSSELHPGPDRQGIESKAFCLRPHLEDVSSACTQHINSSGCIPGLYWQDTNSSACIPEPDPQCINSVYNPASHLHGMNSSTCISGSKLQCEDSAGCNPVPHLQDINSSICTPGPSPKCVNSACTPGSRPQCVNSSACAPGPSPQCVNSSACTPGPSPPCANTTECNPEAHLQCVNHWTSVLESQIQCVNSTGCKPKSHLQGVNSSAYTPGENPQCVNSNRFNPEPLFQDIKSCTFPAPQTLCVNTAWCNTKTHLQDVNSSARALGPESQSVNPIGYKPGPHLQAPKHQGPPLQSLKFELTPGSNKPGVVPLRHNPGPQVRGRNFSELNSEFKLQCVHLGEGTLGSLWQGVKPSQLTPGTKVQDINSDPQLQGTNSLKGNPESKRQCINYGMPSSGPQLQSLKSFELSPGSAAQCTKSVLLNSEIPFQGVKSSNVLRETKFQETQVLKNQLGSWQQTAQPKSTLRPQSNGVKSVVVLPTPLLKDRKSPETSKQPLLCTTTVELAPGYGLQNLRSKAFSPEPCFQNVKTVRLKPGSQPQSVNSSELMSCHSSQRAKFSFAPKPCFQDIKPKEQSVNCQQFPLDEKPVMVVPECARKCLAEPALTSVKFSNLIQESQQEFTSESRWQSVSPVCLPQTGKSVELPPRSFLQNMKPEKQMSQTIDRITESSRVICGPRHQVMDCAGTSMKTGHQAPKSLNFTSMPVYQDAGSSEMTETMEKSVRSTSKPTDKVIDSQGIPLKLDLQVPQSADLTPTLSDVDSNYSEPNPQKSYQIPKTLRLHSWSWPQLQDFKELQTKQFIDSDRMSLDLTNHVSEMMELICETNQQGKEFLRMTPKPENRETRCVEKSPRPCPQGLGPAVVSFERRSQREQPVVLPPKPFCHIPDSASGITPGRRSPIPESINVPSKSWLRIEESSALSTEQTSRAEGNGDTLELTFETWQPRGGAARLTKSQNMSMDNAGIIPVESLDQIIDFVRISPKPLDQVIEFAKTELQSPRSVVLPKVSESLKVIPGPPLQVIKSVTIPQSTSQVSKYDDLTLRMHDVINSEYAPSLWLQNVQSKKLVTEPTHHILETIELSGFQVIRTVLIPKPLLLIVKSEELAPVPCPQVIEPIGDATRSSIKVKECLNLLPRPHLQDLVKPLELTLTANIEVNSAELILQQTSPIEEPTVLTPEQRLQAQKSLGLKTESPNVMEIEDLNQGWVCQNRDSEMITSEELQAENYFSRFVYSPSIPFISSSAKTTELGHLQGSGVPEVSRTLAIKNLDVDLLPSAESHSGTVMLQSSALPLVLRNQPSNESENNMEKPYPEIWEVDLITKEEAEKKHMEELGNSLQNYSPYPLRLLPEELQAGFGARRSSIRSSLGRQQNVWESHVCRQRLPRKYLSNMLMLGNVLGTTMERKLCSQPFLTEGSTMDICQSIQNLFGVPAELMEFSQSPLDRGPRTISQTSVVKNYIQRHILCHDHEKRMPLKMWTRGSTSSIIQQYSGTRLGIKKTNSKLNVIVQETTQDVAVTRKGSQFLALVSPDSTLGVLYSREDAASMEQSKISQNDSPTRTVESHHSLKASSLSQAKTDTSEQLQLLKDLQLKIAAKLLRSQIPHNVPPPLTSGLVLKYPICLQCGRCSGFNCCHKFQSALGPYLLIYPQLHLLSTPEGHGEIRLHLGFRLRTGKRPPVSKHRGRSRADPRKSATSPSRRKAKIHTSASKSPTSRRDFQSRSTQSPASVQAHIRQKQWISQGVVGKRGAKDYEFCHVHSASESGFESNQDEKWAKSSFRKTSDLKYSVKKITKGPKTRNTKIYCNSRITEESPSGTLTDPSRSKSTTTIQTSTSSSKRQSKKSSQPKFIQLLFQGLRQIFQAAHRIVTVSGQKPEDRTRPHNLYSSKNLYPKQKAKDCGLTEDNKRASPPVVKHGATGLIPKEEDKFQGTRDLCRQAQQSKQMSSLQPRPLQFRKTMVSERDVCIQATSVIQPLSRVPNVNGRAKKNRSDEISSPESKNCSKEEAKFEIQERIISDSLKKRTLKSHFKEKHTHKEEQHGSFREEALCKKPSERTHLSASERTHRSVSERRYYSPSQKKHSGPSDRSHCNSSQRKGRSSSVRSLQSLSERSYPSLCKGRGHNPSARRQPSPGRSPSCPSVRSLCSPSGRGPCSPPERRGHIPKSPRSLCGRSQQSPASQRCSSPSKRSYLNRTRRTQDSPSERSHGSLSVITTSSPSGWKRYSSGRTHYSLSKTRLHRPSSNLIGTPKRTHCSAESRYSRSERSHRSHSEKSQRCHTERPHYCSKEMLEDSSPKESPRYSLSKEFKTYLSMSSRDHTKKCKSWTSLEARS